MKTKERRQSFVVFLFFASTLIVLFASLAVWAMMDSRGKLIRANLFERLLVESELAVRLATADELQAIEKPEDVYTPQYIAIKDRIARFAWNHRLIRVYFARETANGLLQYIVDSRHDNDSENISTAPREERSSRQVLQQAFKDGVSSVQDLSMYVEGAEGLISAFSPIFGADGEVVAVVGVDLPDINVVFLDRLSFFARLMLVLAVILSIISGVSSLVSYRRAAASAAAANISKSAFLANMSHEMRTPLNAIIGFSDLLVTESSTVGAAERKTAEKIYTAGATLLSIINDILDISKIDSGKFEIIPMEYDLPSLINDVLSFNIIRIGEKPIKFILDIDADTPSRLYGDDLRIKQICNNLLSNAFKYTVRGTVTWRICVERDEQDYTWLAMQVEDTGIGIHKEDIGKLFADYSQVDTRSNRTIEGTGLGLFLTKRLVEMMGGTISVESKFGTGSVFSIRIRQRFVTDAPIGAEVVNNLKNNRFEQRITGVRLARIPMPYAAVLVVDDNENNLEIVKGILKPYKMRVNCVTSGPEAIELIRKGEIRYSAVFMDHMMPVMDGIEATRIIREEIGTEYAKTVPIIALTANAIVGNEEMFLQHGFQAFLSKPIDIMRLDSALRQWVRNREIESPNVPENAPVPAAGNSVDNGDIFSGWSVEGLDVRQGLARFGGDADTYAGVLDSYIRTTRPLIDKLRTVTGNGLAEYAIIVHGIKSSSRGIGAGSAGDMAEALENAAQKNDWAFVSGYNGAFSSALETLADGIGRELGVLRTQNVKPRQHEPDAALLATLAGACANFDIDGADAAMKALESFNYDKGADLVEWLREQISVSGYRQIAERLQSEAAKQRSKIMKKKTAVCKPLDYKRRNK